MHCSCFCVHVCMHLWEEQLSLHACNFINQANVSEILQDSFISHYLALHLLSWPNLYFENLFLNWAKKMLGVDVILRHGFVVFMSLTWIMHFEKEYVRDACGSKVRRPLHIQKRQEWRWKQRKVWINSK